MPDASHNGEGHQPQGRRPTTPRHAAPTGHASQGDSAWPPHPHTRAHSTWVADPDSPPGGRAVRGGGGPDFRRPSRRRKAPPPRGRPSATPTARSAGPQWCTPWGRCWAATPAPTAPGTHGQRNSGCPPPRTGSRGGGQRPTPDAAHRACKPQGQCWAPTPAHPRRQHVAGGGGVPDPRRPSQRRQAPPTGAPLRKCPQGRTP